MPSVITPTTHITIQPHSVEYRTPTNFGVRAVTVTIKGTDPLVLARTEVYRTQNEVSPMALFASEFTEFVEDAKHRLGR